MVKAELEYNPYLSTASIRFNGKEPHINSLVEKYQNSRLEDWVFKLPEIFRDEMNGYGFELDFTGTALDFEELCDAFRSEGLSDQDVVLVQNKILESRETKVTEIRALLKWLEDNRNRTFDFDQFRNREADIFDSQYSIKMLHGNVFDSQISGSLHAAVENIDDIRELANIDLTDTPIILFIDAESVPTLQDDLKTLLNRNDIEQQQLFFWISASISFGKMKREIMDLGITDPVIISSFEDQSLQKYCLLYPVTDYIMESVHSFRTNVDDLQAQENAARQKNEEANRAIYQQIDSLENAIEHMDHARESLESKGKFEIPVSWTAAIQNLYGKISSWRARKVKTTNQDDAVEAAQDLNMKLPVFFDDFINEFREAVAQTEIELKNEYRSLYRSGGEDIDFSPEVPEVEFQATNDVPTVNTTLLEMKTENYVSPKEDLFGRFFKGGSTEEQGLVLETTYSFQEWRDYALSVVQPMAETLVRKQMEKENGYFSGLRKQYIEHLTNLIQKFSDNRKCVSLQLSDDEKKFQEDVEWLAAFNDRLINIERGYEDE